MATKRELAAEAVQLGQQLGVEVTTDRKNHSQLTELVEELRAKVTESVGSEEPGDDDAAPDPKVETISSEELEADFFGGAVVAKKQYRVAQGRATSSLRGMLKAGTFVKASDFHGGEETLETLKRKGVIVPV